MRRLTALIKKIVPFPVEIQDEFFKIIKVLDLMPGEWIPDDLPSGTTIFVEEGFLALTNWQGNRWRCSNFYFEGTATITYSEGAAEMQEGSCRVRATEPSRIYYLTREDERRVGKIFPDYAPASHVLRRRSFGKHSSRQRLFSVPPPDRIIFTDLYFRILLRAPIDDLAEYLCLETEAEKTILQGIQEARRSSNKYLSAKDN